MNSPRWIVTFLLVSMLFCSIDLLAQDEAGVVRYCRLNEAQDLWSGPSENFKKVREADAGHLLKIIGEKGDFYRVLVPDGFQCYIAADYLELDEEFVGTVIGSRVNLRSIPRVEGDYPIFQVNRGEKMYIWERVGEWYCVTAPEDAYLYVPRDKVTLIDSTAAVEAEYDTLFKRRTVLWETHLGRAQQRRVEREKAEEAGRNLKKLESEAAEGFTETDLDAALARYQDLAVSSEDDQIRKLAKARIGEIEALKARQKTENELALKEAEWRKERAELVKAGKELAKPLKPTPSTHKVPGKGRQVTVIGTVDAQGSIITLRGGKTAVDTLYRVESPDGRYILGDFNSRRVSILGRIGDLVSKERLPLVVVERMEILN